MRRNLSRRPCRRKALSATSDGQLGSTMRRKRRSALCSMAFAAKPRSPSFAGAKALPRACITPSKEFLEAGKRRLAGDTARAATTDELKQLRTAGGVDGMNLEQGRAILDEMQAWATQPQFVYRHEWTVGDLLIWDNTGLIRQRPHCSVGRRWRRADRLSQTAARAGGDDDRVHGSGFIGRAMKSHATGPSKIGGMWRPPRRFSSSR